MKFTKMHGIGNDYVYVNCFEEYVANPEQAAIKVSNRNFGIGSDGLILIKPSDKADFYMDMYNLDGSKGAMCGNGIRCVGKYVYDHKLTDKDIITVETMSGIKTLKLNIENGKVKTVIVDMGIPIYKYRDNTVWEKLKIQNGNEYNIIEVSMGNPHAITYMKEIDNLKLEEIGPMFEKHERFPDYTNTEFIQVIDKNNIKMRVWERGSGETLACGTGACASVVASVLAGYTDRKVKVKLLGGDLDIEWDIRDNHVKMTGEAREVFSGTIEL